MKKEKQMIEQYVHKDTKIILMEDKKWIRRYSIAFFIFMMIEIGIALFIHDQWIRPYVGDVLVVVVIYCAVRIVVPKKIAILPMVIFGFACIVEVSQYFNLANHIQFLNHSIMRIIVGSTFDWKDIICYAIGSLVLLGYEYYIRKSGRIKS